MGVKNTIYLIDAQSAFFQTLANAQCADAGIYEQMCIACGYDGRVSFAAAGEGGNAYHMPMMISHVGLFLNSKPKRNISPLVRNMHPRAYLTLFFLSIRGKVDIMSRKAYGSGTEQAQKAKKGRCR